MGGAKPVATEKTVLPWHPCSLFTGPLLAHGLALSEQSRITRRGANVAFREKSSLLGPQLQEGNPLAGTDVR